MNEFITVANEAWQWVLTWHWGWQVFAGLVIFGWTAQAYEYFSKRSGEQIALDAKIVAVEGLAKVLDGLATIISIAGPIIFIIFVVSLMGE